MESCDSVLQTACIVKVVETIYSTRDKQTSNKTSDEYQLNHAR